MAEVLQDTKTHISTLPENLLLEIFGYLAVRDVCRVNRVCRQWRRVARDNRLWRHVNLLPYKLNLKKTWKLIRAHFSDVLLSLRLRGYLDPAGANWQKASLSDAMLSSLQEKCPNIVTLELYQANLDNVDMNSLPSGLKTLIITHSKVAPGWFSALSKNDKLLSKLRHVDLSFSSQTSNEDILQLCARPTITTLKLNGCYRISEERLKLIAEKLVDLKVLCLNQTGCSDLVVHHISRHLKDLERLDLSHCNGITDGAIGSIVSGLKNLKWLSVEKCDNISTDALAQLSSLKGLEVVKNQENNS